MPYNATWIEPWMRPIKQKTRKKTRRLPSMTYKSKKVVVSKKTNSPEKIPEKIPVRSPEKIPNNPVQNVHLDPVILKESYNHVPKKRSDRKTANPRRSTRKRRTSTNMSAKVLAVKASEKKAINARAKKVAESYKEPLGIKI